MPSSTAPIQRQVIQRANDVGMPVEWDETLGAANDSSADAAKLKDYLDTLAREVYTLLRARLERDRERRGNRYNGRLPW